MGPKSHNSPRMWPKSHGFRFNYVKKLWRKQDTNPGHVHTMPPTGFTLVGRLRGLLVNFKPGYLRKTSALIHQHHFFDSSHTQTHLSIFHDHESFLPHSHILADSDLTWMWNPHGNQSRVILFTSISNPQAVSQTSFSPLFQRHRPTVATSAGGDRSFMAACLLGRCV